MPTPTTPQDALDPYNTAIKESRKAVATLSEKVRKVSDLPRTLKQNLAGQISPQLRARQRELESQFNAAPATFREFFSDVKNPLVRGRLAAQAQASVGKQLDVIRGLRDDREQSVSELIQDITAQAATEVDVAQINLASLQQEASNAFSLYQQLVSEQQFAENKELEKQRIQLEKQRIAISASKQRALTQSEQVQTKVLDFIDNNQFGEDGYYEPSAYVELVREIAGLMQETEQEVVQNRLQPGRFIDLNNPNNFDFIVNRLPIDVGELEKNRSQSASSRSTFKDSIFNVSGPELTTQDILDLNIDENGLKFLPDSVAISLFNQAKQDQPERFGIF